MILLPGNESVVRFDAHEHEEEDELFCGLCGCFVSVSIKNPLIPFLCRTVHNLLKAQAQSLCSVVRFPFQMFRVVLVRYTIFPLSRKKMIATMMNDDDAKGFIHIHSHTMNNNYYSLMTNVESSSKNKNELYYTSYSDLLCESLSCHAALRSQTHLCRS